MFTPPVIRRSAAERFWRYVERHPPLWYVAVGMPLLALTAVAAAAVVFFMVDKFWQ